MVCFNSDGKERFAGCQNCSFCRLGRKTAGTLMPDVFLAFDWSVAIFVLCCHPVVKSLRKCVVGER